jgi:predicted transcriptional regulator
MSWEAQAWVWKQDLKAGPKWVLMGIANYVDQELKAWPSLETLGQRLGMTKQAVLSNMKILIEKGKIKSVKESRKTGKEK